MSQDLNIEKLLQKLENQQKLIQQLTEENETLYQQFNHLMVRNNKLLQRIDDQQRIIDDMHIRMEELQLISHNQLRLNDRLRTGNGSARAASSLASDLDLEELFQRWKSYPGQISQNTPNLRKQVLMLGFLLKNGSMSAAELFAACDIGGVTGARYVSLLKKFGLIHYSGARKKGRYELTPVGNRFVTGASPSPLAAGTISQADLPAGIPMRKNVTATRPVEE